MMNGDLLCLLSKQEIIYPGSKAIVDQGVLYSDRAYATAGDTGRWVMNRFIRTTVNGGRKEICVHIQRMVASIEGVVGITCLEHEQFETQISQILLSIGSLMTVYEDDPSSNAILEDCMLRLLLVNGSMSDRIIRGMEVHV
jgi:hypothetical protein